MDAGSSNEAKGIHGRTDPNMQERTFLTNPAVVDVPLSANLAVEAKETPCSSKDPEQPLPQYARSEILPRIAVSGRWHADLHANYSQIWSCHGNFGYDENGKKIPTSKLDFSEVHQRCGHKDYEEYVNGNRYKACKNCEPDRWYVPRRPDQDDNKGIPRAWARK